MKTIRFAIYGCGVIAKTHAEALGELEGAELVGCADVSDASAEAFSKKYGIKKYRDLDELLSDCELDVINVCTPSGTHADIAIRALRSNKNVVLEKPMAICSRDCDRIIEAARSSRGRLAVISQMRSAPDVQRLRGMINSGALGKILLVELNMNYYRDESYYHGSWRGSRLMDGGGALMNQGIHGVDLIGYLFGNVARVGSIVRTVAHDIEVEDLAVANLEFESGALGVITASTATPPGFDRETRIYGTRGYAHLIETKLVELTVDGERLPCEGFISTGAATTNQILDAAGHKRQLSSFIEVLCGKDVEYIDENEGKRPVEIIEKIYASTI